MIIDNRSRAAATKQYGHMANTHQPTNIITTVALR